MIPHPAGCPGLGELWLPVVDWVGFYEVSDRGNVCSVDRVIVQIIRGKPQLARWRGKLLKQAPTGDGYLSVTLTAPGRRRVVRVHHLVLETFVGPCPEGEEACHRDDVGTHNHLGNLRWDTRSANVRDQVTNGVHNFLAENRRRWSA